VCAKRLCNGLTGGEKERDRVLYFLVEALFGLGEVGGLSLPI